MSKLIEALKAGEKIPEKEKKSVHEITQEELADIYFGGSEKAKRGELPLVIRVIEKPGVPSVVPWIITSVAFLITAFSLFSTKRIFVDVKVIDEKHPFFAEGRPPEPWPQDLSESPKKPLFHAPFAQTQRLAMENVIFEGSSKLNSSFDRSMLTLVNSSLSPFARATMRFDVPMNLEGKKIVFYAKGNKGGENLAFAAKDKDNVLAFDKGKVYPFPERLTSEWQKAEVALDEVTPDFKAKNVASLRFEFGSNTDNSPGDIVFVKDVQIVASA